MYRPEHRLASFLLQVFSATSACYLPVLAAHAQDMPAGAQPGSSSAYNNKLYRVEIRPIMQTDLDVRREASAPRQIYGRSELDKFGDTNLSETLRRLPGIDVQEGVLRLRGLGAGYSQLLIDGEPAPHGFSLNQLSPAQVERIEVSKAATADQSAQAIGGTVNIVLRSPVKKQQASAKIGASYSSARATPNASMLVGTRAGGMSFSLPVSAFEWRGNTLLDIQRRVPVADAPAAVAAQHAVQDSQGHNASANPQLTWKVDDDSTINLQAFLQRNSWKSRVAFDNGAATSPDLLEDPNANDGRFSNKRLSAQLRRRLNDASSLELKLSGGAADDQFANQTYRQAQPFRRSVGSSTDRTFLHSAKVTSLAASGHTLTGGWEVERRRRIDERHVTVLGVDQLSGIDGVPFSARVDRRAFYLQDDWKMSEHWNTYLGVRHESVRVRSDDLGQAIDNTSRMVTPLLHLTYRPGEKSKDLIRASLTRSYKTPDIYALIARPSLNSLYPFPDQTNSEIAADRAGNPALRPELATGIDLSYERYLSSGAMLGFTVFQRRIKDLIRHVTTLEQVSWAGTERWVSRPLNYSSALTHGVEVEFKGTAHDLMPMVFDRASGLSVRGALNYYRSKVRSVPGPDNRLDNQQPWSGTMGMDYKARSMPLSVGANLSFTPGYTTRQTPTQTQVQGRSRALDLYGQYPLRSDIDLRIAITNAAPVDSGRVTTSTSGAELRTVRTTHANYSITLDIRFK